MHRYLLHNEEIRDTSEPLLSPGQVGFLNGWGIFSTLRVSEGVLFVFERHYARMQGDAVRMHVPFTFSPAKLRSALESLVDRNGAANATLRVAIVRNRGGLFEGPEIGRDSDLVAFTADLTAWDQEVKLGYKPHARFGQSPFAGAKIISWAENLTWYEEAHERGLDEYVLLNEHGHVSECTSANLFVIQGNHVYTPPVDSSGCLPGVTRAILLDDIRLPDLTISERILTPGDLHRSDGVFITSSTRDLLPVFKIEGEVLHRQGSVFERVQSAFTDYTRSYIRAHSRKTEIFAA